MLGIELRFQVCMLRKQLEPRKTMHIFDIHEKKTQWNKFKRKFEFESNDILDSPKANAALLNKEHNIQRYKRVPQFLGYCFGYDR